MDVPMTYKMITLGSLGPSDTTRSYPHITDRSPWAEPRVSLTAPVTGGLCFLIPPPFHPSPKPPPIWHLSKCLFLHYYFHLVIPQPLQLKTLGSTTSPPALSSTDHSWKAGLGRAKGFRLSRTVQRAPGLPSWREGCGGRAGPAEATGRVQGQPR